MQQTEIDQNTIETGVFKSQILSIAFGERNIREHRFCDRDHFLRKIDSFGNGACLPDRSGDVTGTACDIQHGYAS